MWCITLYISIYILYLWYIDDIKRNPVKSEEYLVKACDKYSNINACYNLAVLYKNGNYTRWWICFILSYYEYIYI